jgi:hypothetical protein
MSKNMSRWKFQDGLRGELTQTKGYSYTLNKKTSGNKLRLFPSLLINYQATPGSTFSLSVGRRINRPSFWNLNPFKSLFTALSYGEGNPYLQPEYNTNYELSHSYKSLMVSSLFFNKTENGYNNVTLASAGTNIVYTIPLNFIKTYRFGISETITVKPLSWWENNELLSFYHTSAYSKIPNVNGIRGFGYYISSTNNFYFNRSKTFAGAINFWYQFPEVDHMSKADRYYKLDLGMRMTTSNRKLDIVFNLNDIFRSSALAYSTVVNGISQKLTNFQINRFFQLSVSYRFGKSTDESGSHSTGNEEERGRIH